ncbi:MAG: hypothetical protein NZM35_07590 [Chitinophagales bacterium]|nr:hypothetical protein [Chitinophagales bacterium]MDW8419079.1 hypothetical protein [Chitinophagales bacterium]
MKTTFTNKPRDMNRFSYRAFLVAAAVIICAAAAARESVNQKNSPKPAKASFKTEAGDCVTPAAQFDLEINNVRARILTGGDMWWNLSEARYEVPKGPGTGPRLTAIFAGAIWISGLDAGNNLKCAGQRYRGNGDDYWPGVLSDAGTIDKATCNKYDRFFSVFGANIEKAQAAFLAKGPATSATDIPKDVLAWPGKGNPHIASDPTLLNDIFVINNNLAPFKDYDNDGIYDPTKGDYPVIPCRYGDAEAYADQMTFWVINDMGNQHSETNGQAIGVQINCLGFAFQTTDDVNNMTFYKYEIVNKSTNKLFQTYVSQWSDPDLGCFDNDATGCDTTRSLGIVYNRTAIDQTCQGVQGYGSELPMIGIDFFEGPLTDDSIPKQLGLSSFVYFTNNNSPCCSDPDNAPQYRNFMTGFWKDGTPFTEGGTGYNSGGPPTKFCFPGNPSDPNGWSECNANVAAQLPPGDRRMVQTSGPFNLNPGASQYVTVGVVFVRPQGGVGVCPNFATTIGPADDKAQALFNTCFKLVDGPAAPTLQIRELNNQLIINLINEKGSNNYGEKYDQVDGGIAQIIKGYLNGQGDSTYTFEGYKLYQVISPTVSATDLNDPSKARLVAQCDVRNGVKKIVNIIRDQALGMNVPVLMVEGKDEGIKNSFVITEDLFATGNNKKLINHKTYYYTAIAYAYNNYYPYDEKNPTNIDQLTPYIQGRGNFKIYSAIPHNPDPRNGGTVLRSQWGDGTIVKRIEGRGNGGNNLALDEETINKILQSGSVAFTDTLTYLPKHDPIGFRVVDPMTIKESDFELQFVDNSGSNSIGPNTSWILRDLVNGDTIYSERNLDRPYQQHISVTKNGVRDDYGFSITLGTPLPVYQIPGNYLAPANSPARPVYGPLESSIEYQNPVERWLSFVADQGTNDVRNWIRSGTNIVVGAGTPNPLQGVFDDCWYYTGATPPASTDGILTDPDKKFDKILNGTWAPYCLTANYANKAATGTTPPFVYGPGFKWRNYANTATASVPPQNTLDRLASVDIVITPDRSKWSRCIVFETGEDENVNQGADIAPNGKGARKGQIRMAVSKVMDSNGNLIDDPNFYIDPLNADTGRSYFPGYAINVETGERLNIAFGEASEWPDQNGADMLWNPTDRVFSPITYPNQIVSQLPYFGGKHFIYVMDTKYDEGRQAQRILLDAYTKVGGSPLFSIDTSVHRVYRSLMWVSIPYLTPGYKFVADANGNAYIPPAEIRIRLRVEKPYGRMLTNATNIALDSLPRYQFSTRGLGPTEENKELAKNALDLIRVVPNPYLAYSTYETDQNSNRVKITNLPNVCNITIYALDGTIIRRLTRSIGVDQATNQRIDISDGNRADDSNLTNAIEWDLKNDKGIPIGSGIYLFHVEAPGLGERTLRWFGAMRPADTSNF